jgi:hypothetical protein
MAILSGICLQIKALGLVAKQLYRIPLNNFISGRLSRCGVIVGLSDSKDLGSRLSGLSRLGRLAYNFIKRYYRLLLTIRPSFSHY